MLSYQIIQVMSEVYNDILTQSMKNENRVSVNKTSEVSQFLTLSKQSSRMCNEVWISSDNVTEWKIVF